MFFDTHLNLYDASCYESAFIQKTTVSSFISTDISLFLYLIDETTLQKYLIIVEMIPLINPLLSLLSLK